MSEALHPEEAVTTLLLVRHGHTAHTESGRLYSDPEAQLTEKGVEQAKALAQWICRENPQVLLSGPSRRVVDSAKFIEETASLTSSVNSGLKEWNVGEWDGKTYLELKKTQGELYGAWSKDPVHNAPPGGESIAQLCVRAASMLTELHKQYEGERLAIVTHSEIIRGFLVAALGMPVENFWRINIPTGSVSKVDLSNNFATVHYLAMTPNLV